MYCSSFTVPLPVPFGMAGGFLGASSLFGYLYWGDDTRDSINSESSHVYYDNQATHTLTIEVIDATVVEFSDCIGITDIDFSNF